MSKFLSHEEMLERMPGLNADRSIGSVAYSDGQFDDARYNIALVETFTRVGGNALNHARSRISCAALMEGFLAS